MTPAADKNEPKMNERVEQLFDDLTKKWNRSGLA
jgi:hypothetical protein